LLSATLLLMASVVFGQTEKTVSKFVEGTILTDGDIGFLSLVSSAVIEASRGSAVREATISGETYKVGQTLTAKDARSIT
jgi:hypothetical protein